jgi:diaminohydroxyphosphoribosylaminopyrimidine deaminase/5-amino-6-(5-phosphoribosylamino)uracil reductase
VVLDSALRLSAASKVVAGADSDLLVICGAQADAGRKHALEARRIGVLRAPDPQPRIPWVLKTLAAREIQSVLIEAGALVNAAALEADSIDKVVLFYAPKLLGGAEAVPSFGGRGLGSLSATRSVRVTAMRRMGQDILVEGYLHDVYRDR